MLASGYQAPCCVIVASVEGPRIYRPSSALADYIEIIGHWHAHVGYRSRASARRHPGVAAAVAAIEANPSIQMAEIRDLVGITTKRLIALFRAEIGLSPKAYARVRRLQAALRLLGSMSGAQVAAEIGYFDQAHFVREFRSFTGMTPTQYTEQRLVLPGHVPVTEEPRHKDPRPLAAARP
jgi:AraC-like DNA-binding protein